MPRTTWLLVFVVVAVLPTSASAQQLPDLSGDWMAYGYTCSGPVPEERIRIEQTAGFVRAVKTSGDACIATGQVTFEGKYDSSSFAVTCYALMGSTKQAFRCSADVKSADELVVSCDWGTMTYRRTNQSTLDRIKRAGNQLIATIHPPSWMIALILLVGVLVIRMSTRSRAGTAMPDVAFKSHPDRGIHSVRGSGSGLDVSLQPHAGQMRSNMVDDRQQDEQP